MYDTVKKKCETLLDGSISKGMIFTYKISFDFLESFIDYYYITDPLIFKEKTWEHAKKNNYGEHYIMYWVFDELTEAIEEFEVYFSGTLFGYIH